MATLRVIADDVLDAGAGEAAVLAEQTLRALLAAKPRGMRVTAFVSASPEGDYARLRGLFPGIDEILKSALARRELQTAWSHGFTPLPGEGFVHATSALAPLRRHDRSVDPGSQTVVTIQRSTSWTAPELLDPRIVRRETQLLKRAARYADAIVTPTHALAALADEQFGLGDRVRVIAAGAGLVGSMAVAADERAADAVVAVAGDSRADGVDELLGAFAAGPLAQRRLVVVRTSTARVLDDAAAAALGDRLQIIDARDAAEVHTVLRGGAVVAAPQLSDGPGLGLLAGFAAGVPVVLSDEPALVELAAGAGLVVERGDDYPARLAEALAAVLEPGEERDRWGVLGADRALAFTWRDAAEKIWQLHADL